jgi:DNA polymerase III delta subunit
LFNTIYNKLLNKKIKILLLTNDISIQNDISIICKLIKKKLKIEFHNSVIERNFNWDDLLKKTKNLTFFDESSIYKIDANDYLFKSNEIKIINELLADKDLSFVLNFYYEKKTSSTRLIRQINPEKLQVISLNFHSADYGNWIYEKLQFFNCRASKDFITKLLNAYESNTIGLSNEINKIIAMGDDCVNKFETNGKVFSIFNIEDLIYERNQSELRKAINFFKFEKDLSNLAFSIISNALKQVYDLHLEYKKHNLDSSIDKLKLWSTRKSKIKSYMRSSNFNKILFLTNKLSKLEYEMKMKTYSDPWHIIYKLSIDLTNS